MISIITLKIVVLLRYAFGKIARDLMPGFHEVGSFLQVKFAFAENCQKTERELSFCLFF